MMPSAARAALRRIHRLGHRESVRPQMAAIGERGVPVDRRARRRIGVGERIRDDVRRRVRDAARDRPGRPGPAALRAARAIGLDRAIGPGE
jgi:hypothetical protein